MKRDKLIALISLSVLALLLTGFTWSYWFDGTVSPPSEVTKTNTMKIGSGDTVTVSTQIGDLNIFKNTELPLVPKGKAVEGKSVDTLETGYSVSWEEDGTDFATGHPGTLQVVYSNFRFQKNIDGITERRDDESYLNLILFSGTPITANRDTSNPNWVNEISFGATRDIFLGDGNLQAFKHAFQLGMPPTKEHYDFVKESTIAFDINITVTPQ
ncbi:hypothetical protein [Erysipelothrix anatis]|uniref:hypothetical protein n=1 Tax=Erysipelothrix anatis TaxID=2683713 RepID=UPI001357DA81|nr:hypothetical protein [Erysipelothrix anatis]